MKTPAQIASIALLAVIVLLTMFWIRTKAPHVVSRHATNAIPPKPRDVTHSERTPNVVVHENQQRLMIEAVRARDLQPIQLYGRVEDQHGSPIPDARIEFEVAEGIGITQGGTGSVYSDGQGLFSISGYTGSVLYFTPIKHGFIPASTNGSAVFSLLGHYAERRYTPDAQNPVVLRMWKESGAEPVIMIEQNHTIAPAEGSTLIDLLTGSAVTTGGDLRVTFERGNKNSPNQQFDWNCTITPVDGGIQRVDLSLFKVTFHAPPSGYTNQIAHHFTAGDTYWSANTTDHVFMTSRGGRVFSKFIIHCSVGLSEAGHHAVMLNKGVANPRSPNWEAAKR